MSTSETGSSASDDALDAIAIIGMSCRFPGAGGVEEYWQNLRDGIESISPVSIQDMLDAGLKPAAARNPRRVPMTSTLTGIESFDAGFFDFSPWQAKLTDPQQRFFLECAWESLESAGYDPATCGYVIGVFAGCSMSTYLLYNLYPEFTSADGSNGLQTLISNDKDYLATLTAYKLNLTGPAVSVQTACSTSLVAVHLACQSLLSHECDMALAGGVTVRLPARIGYIYEEGSILSPDGHCRPLDADAQGTVFGSGAGVVVLKRLADALADGDAIDAVILGSAVNNDGSAKVGFTAPSEDGQAEVVAEALAVAGVEPRTVQYVELHGTGTPLGDPIEMAALTRAFRSRARGHSLEPGTCAVGAVKSNFGHLESAAGIAGLLKTVLALNHGQIPPTLHFTRPNPAIDLAHSPFYVNARLSAWEAKDAPRRACVSSFGIGGTNAHVVVEQAPVAEYAGPRVPEASRPYVLPLSARHPAALAALARAYHAYLADDGPGASVPLHDVCWSASLRRKHHRHRLAVVGRCRDELVTQLAELGAHDGEPPEAASTGGRRKVAFVFPGHGSQWIGMGSGLLAREPVFREAVKRCDQVLHGHTDFSVVAELCRQDREKSLESAESIQLTLFAIQIGLVELWRSLGVEPDAVVGHSMGEIAAAHVAGALSLEDAVRVLCHRSRLIQQTLGRGRMLAVGLPQNEARDLVAGHEAQVSLAISNSPKSTVLSGDPTALAAIAVHLQSQGAFHRWVNIGFASHSPQMDPLLMELRRALRDVRPQQASVPIASTVTGGECDGTGMDAGHWARNLREPVLFSDATRWLVENGCDVFVEISPHPILLPSVEDSLYHLDRAGIVIPSLLRDADEQRSVLEALGALYRAGQPIEWARLYPKGGRYTRLPGYPWQRQRYWVDPPNRARAAVGADDQYDLNDWFYELRWRRQPHSGSTRPSQDSPTDVREGRRSLILADRGGVGRALADLLAERGEAATLVFPAACYRHDAAQQTFHLRPSRPEDFARLLNDDAARYHDVIYLWALDATPVEATTTASLSSDEALICGGALHLSRALAGQEGAATLRMWFVTRDAQAPEAGCARPTPAQAPLWGFGRTLSIEHPNIHCRYVDLDTTDAEDNARTLLGEAAAADQEDHVAFRHSERFVARLVRSPRPDGALTSPAPGQSLQLTVASRGALGSLAFETVPRRAPGPGEVEIRVRATGLNFRDVLNAQGNYPGDPGRLGLECAGEVTSVGEGVAEFRVGDEVVAVAPGCFATFVTVPAVFVANKPQTLTFTEAATIPITFMTAYYGLCRLARISENDKILIDSATSGLGLAAAQLARRAGAEVFGTARTGEKLDYLRSLGVQHVMLSRTLDLATEVMERTGGRGVDIVLNAVPGDYIARNLPVLTTGGRFIEAGEIGSWDAGRVQQERPDACYFILDLAQEARRDPASVGEMLRQVMREFDRGMLSPLPHRVFPLYEVTSAFQLMAEAKHTGKIVVTQEVGLSSIASDRFSADASYLVTGGLGGLGLWVARWMADRGARHLALIGRSSPSSAARAVVDDLTRVGVQVLVIGADVSKEDQLARALETIGSSMPPLRGIIHAAGIIDDGIIMRQDWQRFSRVLAPKVQGTWNLHTQTRHLTLDFFVLFSSIATLVVNGGSSTYTAANAFLDALAHMRRAQGLPVLCINWGNWSGNGLAMSSAVAARMKRQGIAAITPGPGMQALDQAMRQQAPRLAVLRIDWQTFMAQVPASGVPSLLTEMSSGLLRPDGREPAADESDLKRRLDATVPRNRRRVLAAYLHEQARVALGLDQASAIDPRQPLNELGLDSLRAIAMRSTLSTAVGRTLPATVLFDYPTIEGLTGYLAAEVLGLSAADRQAGGPRGGITVAAPGESERETEEADVKGLSAEEVPASLAEEIAAIENLLGGSE